MVTLHLWYVKVELNTKKTAKKWNFFNLMFSGDGKCAPKKTAKTWNFLRQMTMVFSGDGKCVQNRHV